MSVLRHLDLMGLSLLNQDLMSWIYHLDLPNLETLMIPYVIEPFSTFLSHIIIS